MPHAVALHGLRVVPACMPGARRPEAHAVLGARQVVVSVAEHHSNLVPWQMVCQATGATLRHVGLTQDTQEIDMQVARGGMQAAGKPRFGACPCSAVADAYPRSMPAAGAQHRHQREDEDGGAGVHL